MKSILTRICNSVFVLALTYVSPALAQGGERNVSAQQTYQFIASKLPERLCAPPNGIVPKCFDGIPYNDCLDDISAFTQMCFEKQEPPYADFVCSSQEDCKVKIGVIRKSLVQCASQSFEIMHSKKANGKCQ